ALMDHGTRVQFPAPPLLTSRCHLEKNPGKTQLFRGFFVFYSLLLDSLLSQFVSQNLLRHHVSGQGMGQVICLRFRSNASIAGAFFGSSFAPAGLPDRRIARTSTIWSLCPHSEDPKWCPSCRRRTSSEHPRPYRLPRSAHWPVRRQIRSTS